MIFAILYFFSYLMILYENAFAGMNIAEKPPIARGPSLFLLVAVLTYGSIAGIWYVYGWKVALLSFFISWTFNKLTFRFFIRRNIHRTAQRLLNSEWFEQGLSTEERLKKAYEVATFTAHGNR